MNNLKSNILGTMIITSAAFLLFMSMFIREAIVSRAGYIFMTSVSFICWFITDYNMTKNDYNFSEILKTLILLSYLYLLFEVLFSNYPRNAFLFLGVSAFIFINLAYLLIRIIKTQWN